MAKTKAQRIRQNNRNNKKRKLGLKPQNPSNSLQDRDPLLFGAVSDDETTTATAVAASDSDDIHRLIEPYTKDQLIGFLADAAVDDPDLVARIQGAADGSATHRNLFIRGFGWDVSRETLVEVFEPYGPIEDCHVVVDKATGRSKGYGFVMFRHRVGAVKALKQPEKMIKGRMAQCHLASIGPVASSGGGGGGGGSGSDVSGRKIYVSNVHFDAAPDKLKAFFAQFGEIELGPFGYDRLTGRSRGYAIIVYKTLEGARKALEEPHMVFHGRQLHCQLAVDSNKKGKAMSASPAAAAAAAAAAVAGGGGGAAASASAAPPAMLASAAQPVLAAVAAAQNYALYNQNPAYAALLSQNPLLAAAAFNPAAAAMALNPAAGFLQSQGQTLGADVGGLGGAQSFLGAYGSQGLAGLQGLQTYQGSQLGATPSTNPGASFGAFFQ